MRWQGKFSWPDGRFYLGDFEDGKKTGYGVLTWENGNQYQGQFENDVRSGVGVFYWRDGTVYRGQFESDEVHGYGVKQDPNQELELQYWERGSLLTTKLIKANPGCELWLEDMGWMFEGQDCIDGKAHGNGFAVSLNGEKVIVYGTFIVGKRVAGDILILRLGEPDT